MSRTARIPNLVEIYRADFNEENLNFTFRQSGMEATRVPSEGDLRRLLYHALQHTLGVQQVRLRHLHRLLSGRELQVGQMRGHSAESRARRSRHYSDYS